jgi:hypothetical protein
MARHQRVIFGRLPSNDVVLEHASISRQHAALSADATGGLQLTDLGSGALAVLACTSVVMDQKICDVVPNVIRRMLQLDLASPSLTCKLTCLFAH